MRPLIAVSPETVRQIRQQYGDDAALITAAMECLAARFRDERLRFIRSRNTGPRAPLVTREKSVIDGNTGTLVYERNNGHNRIAADVNSVSGKMSGRRETRLPRRVGAEAQCRPAPWA